VDDCKQQVYDIIKFIKIPDVQFRTDIGDRIEGDLKQIMNGYIMYIDLTNIGIDGVHLAQRL